MLKALQDSSDSPCIGYLSIMYILSVNTYKQSHAYALFLCFLIE